VVGSGPVPVLVATDLRKAYGERVLLDGVSVSIHEGERVGVVGNNGAGKSTLARVLAGLEPPDAGTLSVQRGAEIVYLAQEPVMDPDATARAVVTAGLAGWARARDAHAELTERLARGEGELERLLAEQAAAAVEVERLGGWERGHAVDSMLDHLGVLHPGAKVGSMSGGERRRVALARLLVAQPALAILDEPTNHLDVDTIEWLEQYLVQSYAGALLLITHDRWVLDHVVDRTLEVEGGQVYAYEGGWGSYLEAKAERLAHAARAEANRQNLLRTEIAWLRRSPSARTTKQKARIQRAEALMEEQAPASERAASLSLETTRAGSTVLDLEGLVVEVAGRRLIGGLDLHLTRGERVGIVGRNGTGKTSLLRVLLGELAPAAGSVRVGANTRFAYFDQARAGLDDEASVQENVAGQRERLDVGGKTVDVRSYLARFLFPPERLRLKVGALSGGERARVCLARLLLSPANVLLLDEPTNDLDVATLGALEAMLVESDATCIVVSHDRYFLDRVATSILSFEGDGRVLRYVGNYETYRRLRAASSAARPAADDTPVAPPAPARARPKRADKALTFKEERELEGMMAAIEEAEAALSELDAILADPALYAERAAEVPALVARQEEARAEVERLMARWEALEAKKAGALE